MNPVVSLKKEAFLCCGSCPKAFLSKQQLLKHVYQHVYHAEVKLERQQIFSCNICTLAFLNPKHFELHRAVHSKKNN